MHKYEGHLVASSPDSEDVDDEEERRASRRRMDTSYKEMMAGYERGMKAQSDKPSWAPIKTKHAEEPGPLTVTSVNQTKDLKRADGVDAGFAEMQSSEEWLKTHSVEQQKLTLKDLVNKATIGRPNIVNADPLSWPTTNKETGKVQQHLQFEANDINEFEYRLNLAIEMYTKRIKWLLQGSRRVFGLIKGTKIAVILDTSDANCGFGRLAEFQDSLLHVIDEQLKDKKSLYMMSFGTDPKPLWQNPRDGNCRIIQEAKQWVMELRPTGGCNLLKAFRHVYKLKDINTIVLALGSVPDQNVDLLCDYVAQMSCGKDIPIHTVAYDCSNHMTNLILKKVAEESGGRYHCYTAASEEQIYTGTDMDLLFKEIQTTQDVINKIKDMRQGLLGTALVSVMNEISTEVSKLPQSRFLPRPPGHEEPLRIDMPKFNPSSSEEWLGQHGLKAKHLDLYQVLAPNAYSYKEEFIPVIRKTVQSQVHEKAMAQFQWHDGSMKNIHVDMTQLFEYQKQLGASVKLFEKRIDWLSAASRKIFGTVVEKNVVLLIDTSMSNLNYLVHIQHSIRLLLEQQIANKDYFNIIAFAGEAKSWMPTMVKPTPENLQKAWKWVLDLQVEGSRNFMSAFQLAVENEEEKQHHVEVEGVYLFTSGIPDQTQDTVCSYIEEAVSGRDLKLHVILFNVDDYDSKGAIPGRYANITKTAECLRNMSHCSCGRFHWFRETGIIESDDIADLTAEIDRALNFSKKCAFLVESVKKKYNIDYGYLDDMKMLPAPPVRSTPALPAPVQMKALPAPKHTALSSQRLALSDTKEGEEQVLRSVNGRPSSATRRIEREENALNKRPMSAKDPMQKVKRNSRKPKESYFFTEESSKQGAIGAVFQSYPNKKSVRKAIKLAAIPDKEDQVTTKEWLRLYSLTKMKLDINKMVSGPDCKHIGKPVSTLNKTVEARACNVFPTVNVSGTWKHLQLLPRELVDYEDQVEKCLRRYLKRLQWLLSGSRRVFGTVVEQKCIFLIDTSGSMDPYMNELRKELASLIWDQLHRYNVMFNMVGFSNKTESWQIGLMEPSEENCHDAVRWAAGLKAHGNTCTLEALQLAFDDPEVEAIYLLTDGKPDTSTAMVLREVAKMNLDRNIAVNTISFNCEDGTANSFLQLMAKQTSGRYHRCHGDFDAHLFAHKLLSEGFQDPEYPQLPEFDGDDLKRLAAEIGQARRFLAQSRSYRQLYGQTKASDDQTNVPASARNGSQVALVGPGRLLPKSAKYY